MDKRRFCAANKKEQIAIGKELPKLQAKNSQAGKASDTPETYWSKKSLSEYIIQKVVKKKEEKKTFASLHRII